MSFLPENLRFQLNPYISNCVKRVGGGSGSVNGNDGDPATDPSTDRQNASREDVIHDDNDDGGDNDDVRALALKVNIATFDAVIRAFISLSAEYCRALQCKHWDRSDDVVLKDGMTEMQSSMRFLCSVANDCHRMIDVHLQELLSCIEVTKVDGLIVRYCILLLL